MKNNKNIIILISGFGSNLKAIIDYIIHKNLPINISCVISNNPDAYGLKIAQENKIKTYLIQDENELLTIIKQYDPALIILAGYMKILSSKFVEQYPNKILNIHPSLLPKYPGLNTHQKVLANKESDHGCTVHFVTKDLDAGPIISQLKTNILITDTESSLRLKVQKLEHELYPKVIETLICS